MWAFIGRLSYFDMKLIGLVKGLEQDIWHENTRPSSNKKYVLKLRKSSRNFEPHTKHFLDMIETKLYERLRSSYSKIHMAKYL